MNAWRKCKSNHKSFQNLPEASPIHRHTRLPTFETLRPCAGSTGVEIRTLKCRQRGLGPTWPFWTTLAFWNSYFRRAFPFKSCCVLPNQSITMLILINWLPYYGKAGLVGYLSITRETKGLPEYNHFGPQWTLDASARVTIKAFKKFPRLHQSIDTLDCQRLKPSDPVPAAMGSRFAI
jgi:hypothetical protein